MASTKNITMKEYNGVDYDTLYPKTIAEQVVGIYSKDEILSDETKQLFGYTKTAVPNDIFITLGLGQGQYGYRIIVKLYDGTPVVGATVSGINPLPNASLITDNKGMVLGVSTSKNVTISVTSPYIDVNSQSNIQINSSALITEKNITLTNKNDPYIFINTTQNLNLSPLVSSFDTCAVGGGGAGNGQSDSRFDAGGGGGGGGVLNVFNTSVSLVRKISITIGSGGSYSRNQAGGDGGTTIVKIGENIIAQAEGGKGGPNTSGADRRFGIGGKGGVNGGDGGSGSNDNLSEASGKPCTANIFNEPSLGLAGSGGGGGGMFWGAQQPKGGAKNGAKGAWHTSSNNYNATVAQVPGGGGGGFCDSNSSGSAGASGGVYLRFHY